MAATLSSAVRIPSPEPEPLHPVQPVQPVERKRKRSSTPPPRRPPPRDFPRDDKLDRSPPPRGPLPRDIDDERARERLRQLEMRFAKQPESSRPLTDAEKQEAAKKEYEKLLSVRSGGTYIPPARLRALQAQITDKNSKEYQRMAWDALKKSINGLINKVNVSNIKHIVPELFTENLIRGRGLFCQSIMKAAAASLPFVPLYAAMAAIVNTKLPNVGELLVNRLIVQFRKAFKRNDKAVCKSSIAFIAHLTNQQVVHELLAAQILLLLLHKPTDDSVEIAVELTREVGEHLEEFNSKIAMAIFDQYRNILQEADIDKRTQYMIEVLFQIRKDRWKDHPAIKDELDLVEEDDQITHRSTLEDEVDVQATLNIFKYDPEWQENEDKWVKLRAEILGEGSDDEEEDDGSDDESSDDEEEKQERELEVKDQSNADLVNLRRTIYLTIKSSSGFEECCHKLMKINLPVGQEPELPSMIIECASQERTYDKFYGLIGERFSKLNRLWRDLFEAQFAKYFDTIHRYEINRVRIIAQFFSHLLASDAIGWHILSVMHLNEEETTSTSRIFIKILFEDLAMAMSMKKLVERMRDDTLQTSFEGLFPKDNTRNTRFAINFFTAIGMGAMTEDMREWLKNAPKPTPAALPPPPDSDSDSDSESVSSYSSRNSRSRSRSRSYDSRSRSPSRNRARGRRRSRSYSSSRSRSSSYDSRSRSPPRRSRRSPSDSRSPHHRRRSPSDSLSRSRSPPRRRRSPTNSRSPPRRKRSPSGSRSPPRRRRSPSNSHSPPRRHSKSRSPARRYTKRRNTSSVRSVSTSPPRKRVRSDSHGSRSPVRRRRYSSYSRSPSR